SEGRPLASSVDGRLSVDIELFSRGGLAVLDAIESMGYNTLEKRPAISGPRRLILFGRTLANRILPVGSSAKSLKKVVTEGRGPSAAGVHDGNGAALERSYEYCRWVARNAASNFYYAFYMLPRPKRDALCAIYAFMRLVDDTSDTPQGSAGGPNESAFKRAALSRWRALLDQCVAGDTSGHAILPAFADAIQRYRIPSRYFHDLISGAEM